MPDEAMARTARLGKVFAGLPKRAVDLILPPACPACPACRAASGSGAALCADCWSSVRFLAPPLCPVLGTPFAHDMGPGIVSAAVLADPPPFARARSAVVYEVDGQREELKIVGSTESDPSAGMISAASPVGKALLGHREGDDVIVTTPAAQIHYRIVEVK